MEGHLGIGGARSVRERTDIAPFVRHRPVRALGRADIPPCPADAYDVGSKPTGSLPAAGAYLAGTGPRPARPAPRCPFDLRRLLLALLALVPLLLGAGPSWRSAPPVDPRLSSRIEAPPFPEGWEIRAGTHAVVGGDPDDLGTVRRVLRHVEVAIPRIAADLGIPAGRRARIYVAHTAEQFRTLQPGTPEAWADATAWPGPALVFLRSSRLRPGTAPPLEQVLDHEIAHLLLGQTFRGAPVPRWLQEGVAQVVAGEYTPETMRRIARGAPTGHLIPLRELTVGFPADPLRAQLAYAESADIVAFLRGHYGEEALRTLVRELASGQAAGAAVRAATGESLEDVDRAWQADLGPGGLLLPGLVNDGLWWGLGGLLLVLGAIRVRRRTRARRARLAREEALEDALALARARAAAGLPQASAPPAADDPALRGPPQGG